MNETQFNQLLTDLTAPRMRPIAIDTETTGLEPWGDDQLIGISFYFPDANRGYYVPIAHGAGSFLGRPLIDADYTSTGKPRVGARVAWAIHAAVSQYSFSNISAAQRDELNRAMQAYPGPWLLHNAPFDLAALACAGFSPLRGEILDTLLLAHAINPDWGSGIYNVGGEKQRGSKALKWLARYLDIETVEETALFSAAEELFTRAYETAGKRAEPDAKKLAKKYLWALPPEVVGDYAIADTRLTWQVYRALLPQATFWGVEPLFKDFCAIQAQVTTRMEHTGFRLDTVAARKMIDELTRRSAELETEIRRLLGADTLNLASSKQVTEAFARVGIVLPGTGKEVLKQNREKHPAIELIVKWRHLEALAAYPVRWLAAGDTIRAQFNVAGMKTGRISSSSDTFGNMQNIPAEKEVAISPKNLLLPPDPRMVIIEVDYATLEIRIAAWIAEHLLAGVEYWHRGGRLVEWGRGRKVVLGDPDFTLSRVGVGDMHTHTMNEAGVPEILLGEPLSRDAVIRWYNRQGKEAPQVEDLVSYWLKSVARQAAKTTNFAAQYGGGPNAIMKPLGVDRETAARIVEGWKDTYPAIPKAMRYFERLVKTPRDYRGIVARYFRYPDIGVAGRYLRNYSHIPERVNAGNGGEFSPLDSAARSAFNNVVQGTAGLITLYASLRIASRYPDIALLATVHDSLILAAYPDQLTDNFYATVTRLMVDFPVTPALKVDFEIAPPGTGWGYKE